MKNYFVLIVSMCIFYTATAQNWLTTGNSGLAANSFLGSTDAKDIIFKAKNKERGRILNAAGAWRLGSANNFAKFDSTGKLTFGGNGAYQVGSNKYVFRYISNGNKGLFINETQNQYEFRNSSSAALLYINTDNGNSGVAGTFKVGAYTLPSTDGTNGQILKTNGAGFLSWSNENGNAYTAGSGINIAGTTISNTGDLNAADDVNLSLSNLLVTSINQSLLPNADNSKDVGSSSSSWRNIYYKGSIYSSGYRAINFVGSNTALGVNALFSSTGSANTASGFYSLYSNTTGTSNTSTGVSSLQSNTEGFYNTATGAYALYSNTNGLSNTAIGISALQSNTSGSFNTASGDYALYSNANGSENTAYGDLALYSNITGYYNTAIGAGAGSHNDQNTYCTFVGTDADQSVTTDFTNSTAIGYSSRITASHQVRIGNTSITSIGGYEPWTDLSDGRFKKSVRENVKGLEFIKKLRPVTYNLKVQELNEFLNPAKEKTQGRGSSQYKITNATIAIKEKEVYSGFVAQEVEKIAKEIGYDFNGVDAPDNENDHYGLRYSLFVVPLVKAVQELSQQNDDLKKEYDNKIDALQKQINELKSLLSNTQANTATNNKHQSINLNNASLDQNIPNPFKNTTTINYTLPPEKVNAYIIITDKSGRTIQQINVSGSGKGSININASTFSSGTYSYSLYVDGKLIGTKQMLFSK